MSHDLDQLGVALAVGVALEAAGARWMIGGSVATSAYGEPRATHDVDLVADLHLSGVPSFVEALGGAFYVDAEVVRDAARRRVSFNVIHFDTTEKIDVFCVGEPFAAHGLHNRRLLTLPDGRETRVPLLPLMLGGQRPGVRSNPPGIGQHTCALLREAGYTDDQIELMISMQSVLQGS